MTSFSVTGTRLRAMMEYTLAAGFLTGLAEQVAGPRMQADFEQSLQNLKRLLSKRGWGRRPWPGGAAGLAVGVPNPAYPRVLLVYWSLLPPVSVPETPLAPVRPGIRGHAA